MTDTPGLGHNLPPVEPPTEDAVLADLEQRFPEVKKVWADFEASIKTCPEEIATEEQAKALVDALGKVSKHKTAFKSYRTNEKKRWTGIANVIQNFFGDVEDKIEKAVETWKPRLKAYQDKQEEEANKARAAELERQQRETERLREEAEERKLDALYAEALQELAEYDERKARERAEQAERDRIEAQRRADEAKLEAERLAREKRERDSAERAENATTLREAKKLMREAEGLQEAADKDEDAEPSGRLDDLVRVGGLIGNLGSSLIYSTLLDEDQKTAVEDIRSRLAEMRKAINSRMDAKEKRRRAKLEKEANEREALAQAERAKRQAEENAKLARAKAEREEHEAAAERARAETKAATKDAREAIKQGDAAYRGQKAAEKAAGQLDTQADRADNRASRIERQIEDGGSDAARVRGNLGPLASATGRWEHDIVDEPELRKTLGELGPHFTEDALSAAVYHWMVAHRDGFEGEIVKGALPGVVFRWARGVAIRA